MAGEGRESFASQQPADTETVLVSAADKSARFLAWAEASNIGDLTLEQIHSDIRWIARNYLKAPTLPLFTRVCAIRDRAFGLLAGHQRLYQSRDLYEAAGRALTLLAWISTDLGRPDTADTHARAALARARDATEVVEQASDELAGPFTCSVDRAGGFWSDVYLALGHPTDALAEADRAVAAFERMPAEWRNPGSERMARVQQVRAHLALSQFDGVYETLVPVLDTGPEYRVRPLMQRLGEVQAQAATCNQRDEPLLRAMREAITVFRKQPLVV
jgi:hypothetical protein